MDNIKALKEIQSLVSHVSSMRYLQKKYYRTRDKWDLGAAMQEEKIVDQKLKNLESINLKELFDYYDAKSQLKTTSLFDDTIQIA